MILCTSWKIAAILLAWLMINGFAKFLWGQFNHFISPVTITVFFIVKIYFWMQNQMQISKSPNWDEILSLGRKGFFAGLHSKIGTKIRKSKCTLRSNRNLLVLIWAPKSLKIPTKKLASHGNVAHVALPLVSFGKI